MFALLVSIPGGTQPGSTVIPLSRPGPAHVPSRHPNEAARRSESVDRYRSLPIG